MKREIIFFEFFVLALGLYPKDTILDLRIIEQKETSIILEWRDGIALSKYFIIIYKEFGNFEYEYVSYENKLIYRYKITQLNEQAVEKPFANVVGLEPNTFYKFGLYGKNGTEKGKISWIVSRTLGEDVRQFPGTRYPDKSGFASLVVLPDELEHWWDNCAYVLTLDFQVRACLSFF